MFIRKKIVRGVVYYAVVETYREDGKVRQRLLDSLGTDPDLDRHIEWLMEHLADQRYEKPTDLRKAKARLGRLQKWKVRLKK